MRKAVLIAIAAGALVVGGTAFAYPGGPGPFGDNDERKAEFAGDLASQLDGVNANEVEQALDTVREERMSEHRAEQADAIASQLEGVSAEQVESVLEQHHEQVRAAIENGERPQRGELVTALAADLGKSEEEIETALQGAHQEKAEQRLNDAIESGDITEEQADQIRERLENGPRDGGPLGPRGHGPLGFGAGGPPPVAPNGQSQGTDVPVPSPTAPTV